MSDVVFYRSESHGTVDYHRYNNNIFLTDGVNDTCQELGCYWIIDIIWSIYPKLKTDHFHVAKVIAVESQATFTLDDGNENIRYKQEIPFTDLKHNIRMFISLTEIADKPAFVIMMPEEY